MDSCGFVGCLSWSYRACCLWFLFLLAVPPLSGRLRTCPISNLCGLIRRWSSWRIGDLHKTVSGWPGATIVCVWQKVTSVPLLGGPLSWAEWRSCIRIRSSGIGLWDYIEWLDTPIELEIGMHHMVRVFQFTALVLLALWLPATDHCALGDLGVFARTCAGNCDKGKSCGNGACSTLENGSYRPTADLLKVPAPTDRKSVV